MEVFTYRARDKIGKLLTGEVRGENKDKAAAYLTSIGYTVIGIAPKSSALKDKIFKISHRVRPADIVVFTQQLATLVVAGVPIVKGLYIILKQIENPRFKMICQDLIRLLEEGKSFSEALDIHVDVFGKLYVGTIRAGEASGTLDEILRRLAELGEHDADVKGKIKTATRYPILAISVLFIAVMILTTFVVPMFASLFGQFKGDLPLPTRILINSSNFVKSYWLYLLVAGIGVIYFLRKYFATQAGRQLFDKYILKMPIFGKLIYLLSVSQFTRITGILLKSGIPVVTALEMVAEACTNSVISSEVQKILSGVMKGKRIAEPMRVSAFFPPMLVEMTSVGEETGKLDEMLFYVSDYVDRQSDYMIRNVSSLIEPVLIIVLGGVVLFLALAIFLPMWNMVGLLRR